MRLYYVLFLLVTQTLIWRMREQFVTLTLTEGV